MATGDLALGQEQGELSARARIVNDFSIIVATVNGSGSQSANSVLLKSIFGMGVPVSGKNLLRRRGDKHVHIHYPYGWGMG